MVFTTEHSAHNQFHFSPNWKLLILGLLLLPILLHLGFWQLQRADEKMLLQQELESRKSLPLIDLLTLDKKSTDNSYRRVLAEGSFSADHYWFIDNKTHRGKVGYHLVMPFQLVSGETVLVNRGWVQAPALREHLPKVETVPGTTKVFGQLIQPTQNTMVRNLEVFHGWPKRAQQIDLDQFESQLGKPILSWIIQINPESEHALSVQWQAINSSPERHRGYALQWFSMSVALVIALLFANSNLARVLKIKN